MAKNIVIFSDGTGQAGGITVGEARTNIYKPYPACSVVLDSETDPSEQVARFHPGLGLVTDCEHFRGKIAQILFYIASQATGLGITRNNVDCYAPLIRLYRDSHKVLLIDLSRGAFTVRSLGGVLSFCGISRRMPSDPLPMDAIGSTALVKHAVSDVYQFYLSDKPTEIGSHRTSIIDTGERIATKGYRDELSRACSALVHLQVAIDGA